MEAMIRINPHGGAGSFQGWRDVTGLLRGSVKLTQRSESTEWGYGLIGFGDTKLSLADPRGEWAPEMHPNSLFARGRMDGSLVEIRYPIVRGGSVADAVVFQGEITTKNSESMWKDGISTLQVQPYTAVFKNTSISAGTIVRGQGVPSALQAMFGVSKISSLLQNTDISGLVIPDVVDLKISQEADLLDSEDTALDTLQRLLQPLDALASYNTTNETLEIYTRGNLNAGTAYTSDPMDLIDILALKRGSERVYNVLHISTGLEDEREETISLTDQPSINRFGSRDIDLDLSWIRNRDVIVDVGRYLIQRLARPRQMLKVKTDSWSIPPDTLHIGLHINLGIRPMQDDVLGWGQGTWSQLKLRNNRIPTITGMWYVEEIQRDITKDEMTLTLREVFTNGT